MGYRRAAMGHTRVALAAFTLFAWIPLAHAGPIAADIWYEFGFTDAGVDATGCFPDDPAGLFCTESSGTPTTFLDAPPWTFTAPVGGSTLLVTDAFDSGDRFELFDSGSSLGLTSAPAVVAAISCGDDPVVCLATPGMSTGSFALGAGAHSITLVPVLSPGGLGAGYLHVSAAAVSVPEPASLALVAAALLGALPRRRWSR